jgi:CubicO group peptidase (beta-lactamase class C family)
MLSTNSIRTLAVLSVVILVTAPASGNVDPDRLSAFVEQGMELWHVPGMSVAVVTSDEVLLQRGFGATDVDGGRAVDEHTLFAIASTTKAMVAAGILMLADDGTLSLDHPVIRHVPELHLEDPSLTAQLTVRDLLAHRTGLPSTDYWFFLQGTPLHEQLTRLRTVPPRAPVRTRLIYQNTMFEIAGLLIERASGQPWHRFLTERLWHPIGMLETYATRGEIAPAQSHVTPYLYLEDRLTVAEWDVPEDSADAAGSVWSSIHDMSLWAQFLLRGGVTAGGDRLISEHGIEEMFEPQQLAADSDFYPTVELTRPNWRSYGLAWFQQDFQGRKIDYHTGSLAGLVAMVGLDRGGDTAIVMLGNRDHAEVRHAFLWEVMDASDGNERRDWNREVFELYEARAEESDTNWHETLAKRLAHTRTSLPAESYAGTYRNDTFGDVQVEHSDGSWTVTTGRHELEMTHWHLDTFLVQHRRWKLREFVSFGIGPDGAIQSLAFLGFAFDRVPAD